MLFILLGISSALALPTKVVNTTYGPVRGVLEHGIRSFLGIPYAKPPLGELRFKEPEPHPSWTDILECTQQAKMCPQMHLVKEIMLGHEDCLYLDVHVPREKNTSNFLPVMFWIYGGGYAFGDEYEFGVYNVKHLVEKHDIIIVSVNYRLGPFGFMALDELKAESQMQSTGNYGLIDQVLGLKWVKDNIRTFGGDPNRVTIMGESAGAFSVCWHMVSPLSTGLFSGAIMESGSCDTRYMFRTYDNAQSYSRLWTNTHGCNNTAGPTLLKCMRSAKVGDFLQLVNISKFPGFHPKLYPAWPWTATIDHVALLDIPLISINKGEFNQVPLIIGHNHDEFSIGVPFIPLMVPGFRRPIDPEVWDHTLMYFFDNDKSVVEKIKKTYPVVNNSYFDVAVRITTDYFFVCPSRRAARSISQHHQSVWMYQFNFDKGWFYNQSLGDFHASELLMIFDNYIILHPSHDDDQMAKTFHLHWTNMFKYGSPNSPSGIIPPEKPDIVINWPAWDSDLKQNINLNIPPSIDDHLSENLCNFWDTIPL